MTKRHPLENQYRSSFLEFTAWQRGRCVLTYIHPNVSTQGPPTSGAVQVNPAKFPLGSFTENLPANRVRPHFARRTFLWATNLCGLGKPPRDRIRLCGHFIRQILFSVNLFDGQLGNQRLSTKSGQRQLLNLQQFNLLVLLRGGFAEGLRGAAAAFDDVLVEQRIVRDGIISVVAGHAEGFFFLAGGGHHAGL